MNGELDADDRERLRAAGRWARVVIRAGAVGLGLVLLLSLDVGLRNPRAIAETANLQGTPNMISGVLFAVASLAAIALLRGYERNVAAFFVRGELALNRAFRRLRQFFVLWTWLTALTALLGFLNALSYF